MKKLMFVLGMAFAGYWCYALVEMNEKFYSFQTALDIVIFTSIIGCFLGLWKSKRWALYLSWVLAAVAFIWGCYLLHFVWTFWIFAEPTLLERIGSVSHPRVSVFVVFPAIWLFYFTRAKVRALFK